MVNNSKVGTPRIHIRPRKRSLPRSKRRPDWSDAPLGRVIAIDRGRFTVIRDNDAIRLIAVKARELGRHSIVIGDQVRLSGDLSGKVDTLARIVAIEKRTSVLRRSLEDAPDQRGEKVIVADADQMVIVVALADPPPRTGMVDRCLVAAYEAGLHPILCLTKTDLADPDSFASHYEDFNLDIFVTSLSFSSPARSTVPPSSSPLDIHTPRYAVESLNAIRSALIGHVSVLVGHSGVGKSTLINALIPEAARETGNVNSVTGRGRHTSTSARAFELSEGGWVVDTPGVRSFGLGHVQVADVLAVFPDVEDATSLCLPLCTHLEQESSCALDLWAVGEKPFTSISEDERAKRISRVSSVRRLLEGLATAQAASKSFR